jgi:hypothetical protein
MHVREARNTGSWREPDPTHTTTKSKKLTWMRETARRSHEYMRTVFLYTADALWMIMPNHFPDPIHMDFTDDDADRGPIRRGSVSSWVRVWWQCKACACQCLASVEFHSSEAQKCPECPLQHLVSCKPSWVELPGSPTIPSEYFSHECKECTGNCFAASTRPDAPRHCLYSWGAQGPTAFWVRGK